MLPKVEKILSIMQQSIEDWHVNQSPVSNPYREGSFEYLIYKKNHVDTIQWHVEDEIRRPDLPAQELVALKRSIDSLNQERTDTVEILDDLIFNQFKNVDRYADAKMNSETPAWLLDRMSILELKIFHMQEQVERKDATDEHIDKCSQKLSILLEQRQDLKTCYSDLIEDLQLGRKFMKVYRQMKMYNDRTLNPSLYEQKPL
jgi:hypothetical protein